MSLEAGNLVLLLANMKILVIGSIAAGVRCLEMRKDVYEDIDLIASNDDAKSIISIFKNETVSVRPNKLGYSLSLANRQYCLGYTVNHIEIIVAWKGSIHDRILRDLSYNKIQQEYASIHLLLTLKESHKYLRNSPHFNKTMDDIRTLRKNGARVIPDYLYELEKIHYDYSHPALNVSKKDFFKDDVPYVWDHDSIHESVAGTAGKLNPAYKKFLVGEVECSQIKFNELTYREKLAAVVEEACVLAIERSLVPFPSAKTFDEAFNMALEKVCTSITSGWFRTFAWEHYHEARKMFFDEYQNYWVNFQEDCENGLVKPHSK